MANMARHMLSINRIIPKKKAPVLKTKTNTVNKLNTPEISENIPRLPDYPEARFLPHLVAQVWLGKQKIAGNQPSVLALC